MARLFFRILAVTLILGGIVGGCGAIWQLDVDSLSEWKELAKGSGLKTAFIGFFSSFTVNVLLLFIGLPIGLILLMASFTDSEEDMQ